MRFWVSWYQTTEDYRPEVWPLRDGVIAYWCTGYRMDGAAVLCAVVEARDEEQAKSSITLYWPEASDWRFVEPREDDWVPWSFPDSRFQRPDYVMPSGRPKRIREEPEFCEQCGYTGALFHSLVYLPGAQLVERWLCIRCKPRTSIPRDATVDRKQTKESGHA